MSWTSPRSTWSGSRPTATRRRQSSEVRLARRSPAHPPPPPLSLSPSSSCPTVESPVGPTSSPPCTRSPHVPHVPHVPRIPHVFQVRTPSHHLTSMDRSLYCAPCKCTYIRTCALVAIHIYTYTHLSGSRIVGQADAACTNARARMYARSPTSTRRYMCPLGPIVLFRCLAEWLVVPVHSRSYTDELSVEGAWSVADERNVLRGSSLSWVACRVARTADARRRAHWLVRPLPRAQTHFGRCRHNYSVSIYHRPRPHTTASSFFKPKNYFK